MISAHTPNSFYRSIYNVLTATVMFLTPFVFAGCGSLVTPADEMTRPQNVSSVTVNINQATAAELERIPYVGASLAAKIIEHRTHYGPFRKVEELMLIDGISDKRFRKIRHLISVE